MDEIETLGAKKLELLEHISALPVREIGAFKHFRARLFRNHTLTQSAMEGMQKAIQRTKDVAYVSAGLNTYGANGKKQHLAVKGSGVLSRRS
ncbi:hypothetical protein [Planktotalea sp.]|uniref:hypothetical protein n=1 Tax=Planktotalea sp. TaxID=2029877 RepID=UPI003F6A63D2